jgi:hypothetical protein
MMFLELTQGYQSYADRQGLLGSLVLIPIRHQQYQPMLCKM